MKARKPRAPEPPPCPACGVRYADWRGEYPGGFKGALSGHKASAWAMHCERCEAYPADAAEFNPGAWDPARTYCERVYTADEWGADAETDPGVVDIQDYLARRWPYVRNRAVGNACLLSTERAQRILGYRPVTGGQYVDESLVW